MDEFRVGYKGNCYFNPFIVLSLKISSQIRHESVKVLAPEPTRAVSNNKALYLDLLFMVIQTMARLENFQEDVAWIQQKLNIPNLTAQRIKETLAELEAQKFLIRDEKGRIAELMQKPEIYRPSVYMSMSLAFDEKNLAAAEKLMIELHHRLSAMAKESVQPTSVVQFGNFMLTVVRQKL